MSAATCPICRKRFDPVGSGTLPFCSDRCRQVDLNRWLSEDYTFPTSRPRDDDEDESPPGGREVDDQ